MWLVGLYSFSSMRIDDRSVLSSSSEKAQGWASAANRIHGAGQSYEYAICNQCSCCQSDHCELHRQVHSATDIGRDATGLFLWRKQLVSRVEDDGGRSSGRAYC